MMKRYKARLDLENSCYIIVDVLDQSAFGLSRFTTPTESTKGHRRKVKLVGGFEHEIHNNLLLHTITQENETRANHIMESIHRYMNSLQLKHTLPLRLFVQLNN